MGIRTVDQASNPNYNLSGVNIDLTRKTGVLIRQSKKGADLDARESRLKQESLVPIAIQLRSDDDDSNIILYDEGSGVSGTKGYDQRPTLSRLYMDIANDVIGSIIVARVDRLFRDKHFRNVGMFTELAEKKRILVIVPGKVVYDFTKTRDLQAFQREMQEAYNYIATQIAYMQDTRRQKVQRGRYGGANLPAPYVIDRSAWKEDQVLVTYKPWQLIAVDLFKQFELCDYVLSRIARYIEDRPFIFPHMSPEDAQRYMFKTRMRSVSGGYTFSSADSIRHYFSNLTLGGYAKIGRDESGNILLLANAHEAAVPMELLAPAYASITGLYPDGSRFEGKKIIVRSRTMTPEESPALLHGLLTSNDGSASFQANIVKGRPVYCCHKGVQDDGRILANKVGIMRQEKLWSVSCEELDHVVVRRLCQIAQFDANLTPRIRAYWEQRKAREVNEETILDTQIEQAEAQIIRLDQLLTNPAAPLSQDAERRYIEMRAEAEADLQRLIKKRASRKVEHDPGEFIPNFYEILAHLSQEFSRLDREHQKRVMRQVIRQIKLNQLSPHLFMLYINWQNGIATCPDVALLWRGVMPPTSFDD